MPDTSLDKSKIRFLLLEGIHPSAIDILRQSGYTQIECVSGALPEDQLLQKISDVHFVGIRSRTQLTAEVLAQAHKLVAVGCFCIGTNQVDLIAARERGIAVFNAPYSNTRSVAELVLAEAILLLRGIPEKNAVAHRGGWLKSADNAYEIRGKTLGIVGYGSIGTQLSVLAEGLGMHVAFYDVVNKLPLGNARQVHNLHALLGQSDIVSLHVPELPSTQWMIGAAESGAAIAFGQAPHPAHPPQRAWRAVGNQPHPGRQPHQHFCAVPADQRVGGLCGDRYGRGLVAAGAGQAGAGARHHPQPRAVLSVRSPAGLQASLQNHGGAGTAGFGASCACPAALAPLT